MSAAAIKNASWATVTILAMTILSPLSSLADEFTIVGQDGRKATLEARLAGSGQGVHALEMNDGQLVIIPEQALLKRVVKEGPEPLDEKAVSEKLEEKFGKDRVRMHVEKRFVICLVVSGRSYDSQQENQMSSFLKKAYRFFYSVQSTFLQHTRRMRVQASAPRHPLVVLIFETDRGFENYAREVTGNQGLSAQNMAGFYSPLTNYLSVRIKECDTFETPLHESIHQQVYNRGIFQRLSPIPTWFNEGMATAFEGDGDRVRGGPRQLSERYARLAFRARDVSWKEIVESDRTFRGDVFAGQAYGQAWALHWLLLKNYRVKYLQYMQALAEKEPLVEETAEERLKELEDIVGKSINELQQEFYGEAADQLSKRR